MTPQSSFPPHSPNRSRSRGTTTERGYGVTHVRQKKEYEPFVAAGLCECARCGERIKPGEKWVLDHNEDRTGYLGPSHAYCNSAAAAEKTNRPRRQTRKW